MRDSFWQDLDSVAGFGSVGPRKSSSHHDMGQQAHAIGMTMPECRLERPKNTLGHPHCRGVHVWQHGRRRSQLQGVAP